MQHRVANSLQIIASVLMQSARKVQSEEARGHLRDAHRRVMSIAAVQRHLAASTLEDVALRPYFVQLCASLAASMIHDPERLSIVVNVDDSVIDADASVSLGLIITELVINALKHAFPEQKRGKIVVDYRSERTEMDAIGEGRRRRHAHGRTQGEAGAGHGNRRGARQAIAGRYPRGRRIAGDRVHACPRRSRRRRRPGTPGRMTRGLELPRNRNVPGPTKPSNDHGKCMSNRKTVVLVVEDNPLIRMCAVDRVVAAGFEALEAGDADEAIRILEGRPDIHLVFTDVSMPGSMDGIKRLLAVWRGLRPANPCLRLRLAPPELFLGLAGKGRFLVPA